MTFSAIRGVILVVLAVLMTVTLITPLAPEAWAQEAEAETPAPTVTPVVTPIPAAEIPGQAGQTNATLREIEGRAAAQDEIVRINEDLEAQTDRVEVLEKETADLIAADPSRSSLEELANRWLRQEEVFAGWIRTLQNRAKQLEADIQSIRDIQDLWQLTLESAGEQELPDALKETVRNTQNSANKTKDLMNARRDDVLTFQTKIADLDSRVSIAMVPIQHGIREQSRSVLIPNQPPIWQTPWNPDGDHSLADRIRQARRNDVLAIKAYAAEQVQQVVGHTFVFVVLVIVFWSLARRARETGEEDPWLRATTLLLRRPIASALLITMLIQDWFHPRAPMAWSELTGLLMLVALCRLLPPILPSDLRPGLIPMALLFLIFQFAVMVPDEVLLYRLALMVLAVGTGASLAWLIGHADDVRYPRYPRWFAAAVMGCKFGVGLMVVSILANIGGSVDLAEILVLGVLVSAYYGLLLWTGTLVLRGAVSILIRTETAKKSNMVQFHAKTIHDTIGMAIDFVAVVLWASNTLRGFGVRSEARQFFEAAFAAEISFFGLSFRPLSIIPVLIVIYLTFKFSKLARFVLANDILPKFSLPRGVPNTILTITHYVILVIGFFIVVTMSGIPLDKFTIIAGALSVGVGFGLQNIVNNFVSGLILLFERPISEGDKIQVGTISGIVKQIGMRASIVRTWQGAEVIVPNADLISKELVNWTLYDLRRRIEIPIGTAYGSDPETVIELLHKVATDHHDVLDDPSPSVPFMGFGDSSLDFEVRAWTLEDIVRVKSELSVAINRTLADHGIEIPFPQRDIHMRSPDGKDRPAPQELPSATTGADAKIPMPADGEGTAGPEMDIGDDDR